MSDPFIEAFRSKLGDMMLQAMDNKAEILATLMQQMEQSQKTLRGLEAFEKFCEEVEAGDYEKMTPRAMAQMIRVLSKTCRMQAQSLLHLSCFALVYGNSKSYGADAADAAMKFGKGQEALQAMLRDKFGGKNPFARKR